MNTNTTNDSRTHNINSCRKDDTSFHVSHLQSVLCRLQKMNNNNKNKDGETKQTVTLNSTYSNYCLYN